MPGFLIVKLPFAPICSAYKTSMINPLYIADVENSIGKKPSMFTRAGTSPDQHLPFSIYDPHLERNSCFQAHDMLLLILGIRIGNDSVGSLKQVNKTSEIVM